MIFCCKSMIFYNRILNSIGAIVFDFLTDLNNYIFDGNPELYFIFSNFVVKRLHEDSRKKLEIIQVGSFGCVACNHLLVSLDSGVGGMVCPGMLSFHSRDIVLFFILVAFFCRRLFHRGGMCLDFR